MHPTEDALSDLVDRIYDLPLQPESWSEISGALEGLTRGRVAILAQSRRSVGFVQACSAVRADADEYLDHYWTTDRAMTRLRAAPAGAAVIDSRLVTDAEREQVAFYRDYLRPRDLHRGCYTVLSRHGDQSLILGIHRPDRRDDFGDECLKVLERVRPHLARALLVARRLAETDVARDAASTALDQTGWGMVLAAADGTVRFVNAGAEAQLGHGLRIRDGRLQACDVGADRGLQTALARAARRLGGEATHLAVPVAEGEVVRLSVSPAGAGAPEAIVEPLALILIARAGAGPDVGRFGQQFGLTPSEIRLVRALVAGERLSHYADRTGVRLTTAKTHLGNVFAKTGVSRQTELVRRALSDPALRLGMADAAPDLDWGGPRRPINADS